MAVVRFLGDVHHQFDAITPFLEDCDFSLQVGDLGFDYRFLAGFDVNRHKFIGGNHDNYDQYYGVAHVVTSKDGLKDFGASSIGGLDFYFVRGAFSIDWKRRQEAFFKGYKSWWDNEELSLEDMFAAFEDYKVVAPDFMVSHDCPSSVSKLVGDKSLLKHFGYDAISFSTRTGELLQSMFEAHKPKVWVFGHYHEAFDEVIDGVRFICVPELGYRDVLVNDGGFEIV